LLNIDLKQSNCRKVDSLLNKTLLSKKGISPILATLLLIVISVAAVIVTYAWVMTFTSTQTQQAGVLLVQENVSWSGASTIGVTVRNTGTSDAKITAVYMGTSSSNLNLTLSVSPTPGGSSATVAAGSSTTFTITYNWSSNTNYYFKFTTNTPAVLIFSAKSP
jgi:flagellin-like protein